jgi:hypothetical protein
MRILFFVAALFLANISLGQGKVESKKYGTLEFVELDHGLAKVEGRKNEALTRSPTGNRGLLDDFQIVNVTDSIQVEEKANFGTVYMVKATDTVDIEVVIEWIYPKKIKNEKGEQFKKIKYSTVRPTNTPTASSYSLDAPYEMVKGEWTMNIYLEDKKVYTRTFILF